MDKNQGPMDRKHDGGQHHASHNDGGPGVGRLAAVLLVAGVVLSFAAGALHPEGANANDHAAAFAEYARSDLWIAVHLGQFAGMAALIAGLLVLGSVVGSVPGLSAWTARLGSWAAAAALALYGGLQAVDGVALKHSVDAWAAAEGTEKAVRFAAAEDMRWLEWGMRSYQSFVLALAPGRLAAQTLSLPSLGGDRCPPATWAVEPPRTNTSRKRPRTNPACGTPRTGS